LREAPGNADLLEVCQERFELRVDLLSLLGTGRPRVYEYAFDLARPVVDGPAKTHRHLAIRFEIWKYPLRRDLRQVNDDMRTVVLDTHGEGARAIWFETLVAGANVNAHAFLDEGGKIGVDHRKWGQYSVLGFI
jgi:hypothetical protein